MINLEEWSDYRKSASAVRCIERNTKSRFLVSAVNHALKNSLFVPEDKDYALGLIGEKAPNSTSN